MKTLGIFGTSGFAREVGDVAFNLGFEPIYIARERSDIDAWTFDSEVILESDVLDLKVGDFAIGIGDNKLRRSIAARYLNKLKFPNLLHPSASFGRAQLAAFTATKGVIVCAGVRFTNSIHVGDFAVFNLNATVGHDAIIEEFVNISPGANISGNVHIGAGCWIGTGAVINQGNAESKLRIGANTIVGSGSVVVKHCERDAVYVGIPARKIK